MKSAPLVPADLLHVVGAAVFVDDRCLATQRSAAMAQSLKWEFPGGKVEASEGAREALQREILEELGLAIVVHDWLGRGTDDRICLDVFAAEISHGEIVLAEHRAHRWIGVEEIDGLDWADPDRPVLDAVRRRLSQAAANTD